VRQIRLASIKSTFFITPTKEATVEKINLSDCIPFVNSDKPRRDQFLKLNKEKARAELHKHFLELKRIILD
jgi:hypothetical protein